VFLLTAYLVRASPRPLLHHDLEQPLRLASRAGQGPNLTPSASCRACPFYQMPEEAKPRRPRCLGDEFRDGLEQIVNLEWLSENAINAQLRGRRLDQPAIG
jgi:hypothetical protein